MMDIGCWILDGRCGIMDVDVDVGYGCRYGDRYYVNVDVDTGCRCGQWMWMWI